jgi:antitoxin (DNA-binding transcriptional repressor) of toxin-antitoxin stability system
VNAPAIDLIDLPSQVGKLVEEAARTGEVVLTREGQAVAKIIPLQSRRGPRRPGSASGLVHMADDFDATPEDFKDYV